MKKSLKIVFSSTLFLSAFLLFQIQPIFARFITPRLGGSNHVWITSMMLFQAALLIGYLYALVLSKINKRKRVHITVLLISAISLPIIPLTINSTLNPFLFIVISFLTSVGLPYTVLSSASPLFQKIAHEKSVTKNVFRYFSLSNTASLAGLISYPFFIEPYISLDQQATIWSISYGLFILLSIVIALKTEDASRQATNREEQKFSNQEKKNIPQIIIFSAIPSALFLAVTATITQDIASIPFFWILPLSLYLLSFSLAFLGKEWKSKKVSLALLFFAGVCFLYSLTISVEAKTIELIVTTSIAVLILCFFLHLEVYKRRPAEKRLEVYYIFVAIGGMIGGVLVSIIFPLIFPINIDTHIISSIALISIGIIFLRRMVFQKKFFSLFVKITVVVMLIAYTGIVFLVAYQKKIKDMTALNRNFYGTISVEQKSGTNRIKSLFNGNINHGFQFLDEEKELYPTSYYGKESGVGVVFQEIVDQKRNIAVIGLGAGTIATYGKEGDQIDFYEINPQVIEVAQNEFTYLEKSKAKIGIIEGDARIQLERRQENQYDAIIIDAFTSDSIPIHLITEEAISIYKNNLKPHGVLAIHISNRYIDLKNPIATTASTKNMSSYLVTHEKFPERGIEFSEWVICTKNGEYEDVFEKINSRSLKITSVSKIEPNESSNSLWTDNFHSIFPFIK